MDERKKVTLLVANTFGCHYCFVSRLSRSRPSDVFSNQNYSNYDIVTVYSQYSVNEFRFFRASIWMGGHS